MSAGLDPRTPSPLHSPLQRRLAAPVALLVLRTESGTVVVEQTVGDGCKHASRFAASAMVATGNTPTKKGNVVVATCRRVRLGAKSGLAHRRAGPRGHLDRGIYHVALGRQAPYVGGASEEDQVYFKRSGEYVERERGASPSMGGQHGVRGRHSSGDTLVSTKRCRSV